MPACTRTGWSDLDAGPRHAGGGARGDLRIEIGDLVHIPFDSASIALRVNPPEAGKRSRTTRGEQGRATCAEQSRTTCAEQGRSMPGCFPPPLRAGRGVTLSEQPQGASRKATLRPCRLEETPTATGDKPCFVKLIRLAAAPLRQGFGAEAPRTQSAMLSPNPSPSSSPYYSPPPPHSVTDSPQHAHRSPALPLLSPLSEAT